MVSSSTKDTSAETPTIRLYDNRISIHAQYARVVLDELGIDYTKVHTELPFENLTPEYAAISKALSVPAMTVVSTDKNEKGTTSTFTDSRDIIMCCQNLPGGDKLFPKDDRTMLHDIEKVLDQVYSANGGQLSFQAQNKRDPLFRAAIHIVGKLRDTALCAYRDDPQNAPNRKCYEDALMRAARPSPTLETLTERANKVMIFLNQKLEESKGPWLLGVEHTAADSVAAIWIQWIVWARAPGVLVPTRVREFLERAKKRPAWKKTDPGFVIHYLTKRIYTATAVVVGGVMASITYMVWRT